MKTITKTINLYEYNELEEEAKKKAKEQLLSVRQECCVDYFTDISMRIIESYFPVVDGLNVQWSLSSSQGDGVNIYGKFDLQNVEGLEWLKTEVNSFKIAQNYRYCYSLKSQTENQTVDEIISDFEYASGNEISDWQVMEIKKMVESVFEKLREAEKEIEDYGYEFFYEVSDEEMEEDANANGILYLEDGTEYFE